MLFHVRMDVHLPVDMLEKQATELKLKEKNLAQQLQKEGKWRHLWRIVGQYSNISIFDVDSSEELHNLLQSF